MTKRAISVVSTKELSDELSAREGVSRIELLPYEEMRITTGREERTIHGPAIILINQD